MLVLDDHYPINKMQLIQELRDAGVPTTGVARLSRTVAITPKTRSLGSVPVRDQQGNAVLVEHPTWTKTTTTDTGLVNANGVPILHEEVEPVLVEQTVEVVEDYEDKVITKGVDPYILVKGELTQEQEDKARQVVEAHVPAAQ